MSQYLLIKSPPASGKSRALMFLALDKLKHQDIKRVIVTVPERTIGSSFAKTNLKESGFFEDWLPNDQYNLCTPGSDISKSKIEAFKKFMESDEKILICTHATFRFACDEIDEKLFNDSLIALDEFHHVSADRDNRIGEVIRSIMNKSTAHVVAMTGSYFRGDSVPILLKMRLNFQRLNDYYEQLNGYKHLSR